MSHIVVIEIKNGKVDITKEELQKILDDAYNRGYSDGRNSVSTITYPSTTPYWHSTVTCNNIDPDKAKVTL